MNKTLLTGLPGFIGSRLARKLLDNPDRRLVCLVEPRDVMLERARAFASEWNGGGRVELVPADIAKPRFGLDVTEFDRLRAECSEVYHLAALYNLAAPKRLSYDVNVEGTRHVLGFCEGVKHFRKLVYFSTIVVSGDRTGTILESDLEAGQRFRNWYEETKYLAEVEVRRRAGEVPSVVIRPAVVIGDSRSGEIDKYDGPYYVIAALARLEREGKLGSLGRLMALGRAPARFHLIPVDYLVAATVAIAARPESIGRTHQVIDPNELHVGEFRRLVLERFGVPEFPVSVDPALVRGLMRVPGMERFVGVPRQVFDYLDLENRYDFANTTAALEGSGVACPPLPSYIDTLIAFVRSHPEVKPPGVAGRR
ncbi:MAG TPA: SDR family oxidoreductase [Planctomycetota bacterium]|nr:SDR family oxidoreductase [Planctomycetota bacterium]